MIGIIARIGGIGILQVYRDRLAATHPRTDALLDDPASPPFVELHGTRPRRQGRPGGVNDGRGR